MTTKSPDYGSMAQGGEVSTQRPAPPPPLAKPPRPIIPPRPAAPADHGRYLSEVPTRVAGAEGELLDIETELRRIASIDPTRAEQAEVMIETIAKALKAVRATRRALSES